MHGLGIEWCRWMEMLRRIIVRNFCCWVPLTLFACNSRSDHPLYYTLIYWSKKWTSSLFLYLCLQLMAHRSFRSITNWRMRFYTSHPLTIADDHCVCLFLDLDATWHLYHHAKRVKMPRQSNYRLIRQGYQYMQIKYHLIMNHP